MMKTGFMPSLMLNMWNSFAKGNRLSFCHKLENCSYVRWMAAFTMWEQILQVLDQSLVQTGNCNPFPPSHECSKTKETFLQQIGLIHCALIASVLW